MKPTKTSAKTPIKKVRCAIYTRKSSEEGLDMEFNSLDAQRESCAAYYYSGTFVIAAILRLTWHLRAMAWCHRRQFDQPMI